MFKSIDHLRRNGREKFSVWSSAIFTFIFKKGMAYSVRMRSPEDFERFFVDTVIRLGEAKGLNHTSVAQKAFGMSDSAVSRWRQIRNPRKSTGRAQSLTLEDAVRLSKAIEEEFPSLCFKVWETMKMHESQAEEMEGDGQMPVKRQAS